MTNEERLEKIKEVHLERIKQNEFYTASFIHVDWLIEKIEGYENKIEEIKQFLKDEIKRQENNWNTDDHSLTVEMILDKVKEIEKK